MVPYFCRMTKNHDLLDDLLSLGNLPPDYSINRFGITKREGRLIISEGRTKNRRFLFQAVLGMLLFLVFSFLTFMSFLLEMGTFGTLIFFAVSLLFIGYAINSIIRGYFSGRKFIFDQDQLLMLKRIGGGKRISKMEIRSIYVRDLIIRSDRRMELRLGKKAHHSLHEDITLLTLDFPNESWFSSAKNLQHIENTKEEAYQIGKLISEFWNIPFKV